MKDNDICAGIGFILGFIVGAAFFILSINPGLADRHYKQGQIDYANDIIKYELQEQDNHEYIWVRKDVD